MRSLSNLNQDKGSVIFHMTAVIFDSGEFIHPSDLRHGEIQLLNDVPEPGIAIERIKLVES